MEFHFRFQKGFSPTSDLYLAIRCENVAKNPDTLFKLIYIVVCYQHTYWYHLDKLQSVCICKCKKSELLYSKMKLNMWLQQNMIRFGKQTHPKKSSMSISLIVTKISILVSYTNLSWCHLNAEIENILLNILISCW